MKCPKCGYTSFDYLDNCKRCGVDLSDTRTLLQIIAVSPDERAAVSHSAEVAGGVGAAHYDDRAAITAPAAGSREADLLPPAQDQGVLEDLNFDQSFADMVETTSHKGAAGKHAGSDDALLDIDFGDVFGEKEIEGS